MPQVEEEFGLMIRVQLKVFWLQTATYHIDEVLAFLTECSMQYNATIIIIVRKWVDGIRGRPEDVCRRQPFRLILECGPCIGRGRP